MVVFMLGLEMYPILCFHVANNFDFQIWRDMHYTMEAMVLLFLLQTSSDLMQNPLIVPVKVLKGHSIVNSLGKEGSLHQRFPCKYCIRWLCNILIVALDIFLNMHTRLCLNTSQYGYCALQVL